MQSITVPPRPHTPAGEPTHLRPTVTAPLFDGPPVATLRAVLDEGGAPAMMRWARDRTRQLSRTADRDEHLDPLLASLDAEPLLLLPLIEMIGALPDRRSTTALTGMLGHHEPVVRAHAAWRLRGLPPARDAVPPIVDLLTRGGLATLLAHRTLRDWSTRVPGRVDTAALAALDETADPARRARLVDLLGAVGSAPALDAVRRVAADPVEHDAPRCAAVAALGDRGPDHDDVLRSVATGESPVAATAALALHRSGPDPSSSTADGLRVAQLVLTGRIDGQLSLGGRGDTGGVASLLVSLGDALSRRGDVANVLTIGRGSVIDALADDAGVFGAPQSYATVALGDTARPADGSPEMWEHLPAVARGLRRALDRAGDLDILHLRMGDVGTLVGAEVARERGIPVCFSAAADPHNVLQALHARGELDTDRFLQMERDQHVWFRARLVEEVAARADRVAFFPHAEGAQVHDLLGLDRHDNGRRTAVVGEGIDLRLRDHAEQRTGRYREGAAEPAILRDLCTHIPSSRRDRALLVSVGRLHPVKGMARVVEAWADEAELRDRYNLVIVGGDLADPSPSERGVLEDIDRIVPRDDPRREGLVLLGGRPRPEVAALLAAADRGRSGWWAPDGVYVDGAMKEEFGLAVLEAMAAGLTVVAPANGGPSTYVENLRTGVLVAPDEPLSGALVAASALVSHGERRARARSTVEQRYSIDAMAHQLADLYHTDTAAP